MSAVRLKINSDDQIAGPDWLKSHDALLGIVGKAPPETSRDQFRLMRRKLLTERFQLTLHHEQRELAFLALVADKKGSKLQEAAPGTDAAGSTVWQGQIVQHRVSITALMVVLGRFTGRPIVDMTEMKGSYDVKLEWIPLKRMSAIPGDAGDVPEGPIFEAVEEQLGLKLETRKGPMDVIVVDHAEKKPLPN